MATTYKIHPAIGIARLGNSPNDFFIGPEIPGQDVNPPGGFKDNQCRVKRQAARFRIFAHHDDGTVQEITHNEADITWTVHLVNKKAAHPGRGNSESASDLTIDPGNRTINGPNQQRLFDNGVIKFSGAPVTKVPLGEIRSDQDNHLLVLGGFGKSASPAGTAMDGYFWASDDWYDDVADGPVSATIRLRNDNSTPAVTGAWVLVGPPKFAVHIDSVITLYDRIFQTMVSAGFLANPTTTSYTKDVYPILQRARDAQWVEFTGGAHTWADPVVSASLRNAIFNRLRAPGSGGSNMPDIRDSGTRDNALTQVQYDHMTRWKDNNFTNDWVGIPVPSNTITPAGLDKAALDSCVGGAFYPGIEAGGLPSNARPIIDASLYFEAFRLNHGAVSPGGITYEMALPWQNDFYQCGSNWWPVPRPNSVIRQGMSGQAFTAGVVPSANDMVDKWHKLGFILRNGNQHTEFNRCDIVSVQLMTPAINFIDVPQGPMGMTREVAMAITFEVISPGGALTLQYAAGGAPMHPQLAAYNNSVTVGPTNGNNIATARFWLVYRTGTAGSVLPQQTLRIEQAGTSQSWQITVNGNTVPRKTAAVSLVLDRSGSMTDNQGDGTTKHAALQTAAGIFIDVMLEGDGAGVVRFNQDAQVLQQVLSLEAPGGLLGNRQTIKDTINGNGLDPSGQTSIGDGIFEGRGVLNGTTTAFDLKSLVVLTDGIENSSRMIADVSAQINEYTYAIGFGQPHQISVPALQTIAGNNGGYMLVTGAIGPDNRFLLQKYFLQILAGISNAEIVLDPGGMIYSGQLVKVPFHLTAADSGVDVILLTPNTKVIDFRIQTPSGRIIEPWQASIEPGMRFVLSEGVSYYRLALPVELMEDRFDGGGTWHALLMIGKPRIHRSDTRDGTDANIRHLSSLARSLPSAQDRGARLQVSNVHAAEETASVSTNAAFASSRKSLPYSIIVHAYSNLGMRADLAQSGYEPGATVDITASVSQSGIPFDGNAQAWAEIRLPNGTQVTKNLAPGNDGTYDASFKASIPGVYTCRIRVTGNTANGEYFTRERTLTAAVWRGGEAVVQPPATTGQGNNDDQFICTLISCFLKRDGVVSGELEKRLREMGIDLERARECVARYCKSRR